MTNYEKRNILIDTNKNITAKHNELLIMLSKTNNDKEYQEIKERIKKLFNTKRDLLAEYNSLTKNIGG